MSGVYIGDLALGQTARKFFATNAAAGGRVDFSNALEAADIRVYKNGGVTQRASEAGYTVTSGFDSMVGGHYVAIDTSDNTDAGFYVQGADYAVFLYPDETVDGQSVAVCLFEFSIENRFPHMASNPALSVGAVPLLGIIDRGHAQSASGTVIRLRSATPLTANDVQNGATLMIRGSTQGYWQERSIVDYDGTTKDATVDTLQVTPTGGTLEYIILAGAPASASALPTVLISVGTGTGQINLAAGKVPATIAAGDLAANSLTAAAAAADFIAEVQSGLALASALSTVAGYLDTEIGTLLTNVATILAAVDTEVAAIKAKTDTIPGSPAAVGSEMALDSTTLTALTIAVVRALNGADGFGVEKDVANNQIILTIPGVGTLTIPAVFASSSPAITKVGA